MIRLFDEDSYIKDFSGTVTGCEKNENGYLITLDKTAFFPTAGGQDCDSGELDGQTVSDVFEENGEIFHLVNDPIEIGKTVSGKILWEERYRKMQHHSAEHIVSGLAYSIFGLNNVGFHLSDTDVIIDYDAEITEEQLSELELCANSAVWKNAAITAYYPDIDELSGISYRSKKAIETDVRIVKIDGIDVCACCAPHLKSTGEIGIIKFTDMMRHRGGVRIRMICGKDAFFDYDRKQSEVFEVSKLLSAPQDGIFEAVKRVYDELSEQKRKNSGVMKKLAQYEAKAIPKTDGNFWIFSEITDKNAMNFIANEAAKCVAGTFCIFSGDDISGYDYIITSKKGEAAEIARKLNIGLSGKGGGKSDAAMGHFSASKKEAKDLLLRLFGEQV